MEVLTLDRLVGTVPDQVDLRDYLERLIEVTETSIQSRMLSLEKTIDTALSAMNSKLETLTTANARMIELQATYVTRDLYDKLHAELEQRVDSLEGQQNVERGRRDSAQRLIGILALLGTFLGSLATILYYVHR
jgi:hypothetical protein